MKLTGKLGDLIVADTSGFHRGLKAISKDRSMLTLDYLVHEEFKYAGTKRQEGAEKFVIGSADYESLTPKQKAGSDFLEVVNSDS